jgi:protein-S-isoprenylcysteine O-methyltransferase Ste14
MILLGDALVVHSMALTIYWVVWFAGANIFVLWYEEPALRRRFGSTYDKYTQRVGRWIPRFQKRAT